MDLARELVPYALTASLTFSRTAGFVVASPFPGRHVAATQRVGLALTIAWMAGMVLPPLAWSPGLDARTVGAAVSEFALGVTIGATFRLVFSAAEVLSQNLSQAVGLSAPSVFNPTIESQESALGESITLLAMLLALAMGAHRVAIEWLLASFHALPVGATPALHLSAPLFVDLVAAATSVGLRLALPAAALLASIAGNDVAAQQQSCTTYAFTGSAQSYSVPQGVGASRSPRAAPRAPVRRQAAPAVSAPRRSACFR